jgi:AcrR family transcriptional regulator
MGRSDRDCRHVLLIPSGSRIASALYRRYTMSYSGAIVGSMNTRATLLAAALKVLEDEGEVQFSTRAVCALANVTAPTLYHHYGSADGLLSAAMTEAFSQFLESKKAAVQSADPVTALREGWDDYVRFAAARPRLYAAMMSRVLNGAQIPAAEQAFALLIERIAAIAADGRLALAVAAAADLLWASANAASLLYVTAQLRKTAMPTPDVLKDIRENALQAILIPESKG